MVAKYYNSCKILSARCTLVTLKCLSAVMNILLPVRLLLEEDILGAAHVKCCHQ